MPASHRVFSRYASLPSKVRKTPGLRSHAETRPEAWRESDPRATRQKIGEVELEMIGLRLVFGITLLLGGLSSSVAAEAQPAAKIARIGYLAADLAANPQFPEAFRQGLRDLGYIEGQNILIEYRSAAGHPERLLDLAADLARLKVDVLVSEGTPPSLAAK